jgi:hypothetical protein
MKKYKIVPISIAVIFSIVVALWMAIQAPARAVEQNLAAVNSISVGETTESELLSRKEFQALERMCNQDTCLYHMAEDNSLLRRLHLAPPIYMWAVVQVREGLVSSVSVNVTKSGLRGITMVQVPALPKECASTPCLKQWALPNKTMTGYTVYFDRQSDLRNHMPQAINAQCWSRLRGCSTYAELVPLSQGLNLGEISGTASPAQKSQP